MKYLIYDRTAGALSFAWARPVSRPTGPTTKASRRARPTRPCARSDPHRGGRERSRASPVRSRRRGSAQDIEQLRPREVTLERGCALVDHQLALERALL